MLYPKRNTPLTPEDFRNPGSEYRATPFWAWNNKLDSQELCWQIDQFKKMGFGGFHMHVRTGMATEYLSDEYMGIVKACVEKAREENMLAWLYDEDRWPSGAAGGLVTREEKYRLMHLLLTRTPYGEGVVTAMTDAKAAGTRTENGRLLACFDIRLNPAGELEAYRTIGEHDAAEGFKLYAYEETAVSSPWYNNQTYANTLDPATIQEFIRVTYQRYQPYFQADFGGLVPAMFTDEPQFSKKDVLGFAFEDKDITLPWTFDVTETYGKAYGGESLLENLPQLLWDLPGGRISQVRYHYHDHIAERFASAFADQCGDWCAKHGLMLTGHMMQEPTLESQTGALGDAMRSYRSFHLPGIDMLCDRREYTTAKQAQSAARQYGRPGVLSELYGVTNWDFDFRGHKLQGDWQAALGVTVRVPHLSWVSMNGEAKRDYPSTFSYQSPWYGQYPAIEDHFARVASAMTRGKAVCRVAVLHPVESYWLHWGAQENTLAVRSQMDESFRQLCEWLLRGQIDFDYLCESTLPGQCDTGAVTSALPVGDMRYDVVVVPAVETIRQTTLERLEAFRNAGGRLIFLGGAPRYMDAYENDGPRKLWERSEQIPCERLPVLAALSPVREVEVLGGSGAAVNNLMYQLREEEDGCRWFFLAQADDMPNKDVPLGDILRIKLRGEWSPTLYDTITGEITPLGASCQGGWTVLERPFYEHDSLLLKLEPSPAGAPGAAPKLVTDRVGLDGRSSVPQLDAWKRFYQPVPVTLHEPNVLLLDMAEYALDDGAWRPLEEILRLDNALRLELGWPLRGAAYAQPWVEHDASTPHTLRLRYAFQSECVISGAKLALENAARTRISLNGSPAGPVNGWYVDKCIGTAALPDIRQGSNSLILEIPYGKKVDVEACYLLGAFGVRVSGVNAALTAPVERLAFGDITRQGLPFYGGNLTYHLEAESKNGSLTVSATCYRGHMLRVLVDGKDYGMLTFSPYRLTVNGLPDGPHRVDLVYFGSRVNTFGQLHCNDRSQGHWWGPNSWRSHGPAWTYEYRFWEQGILKTPEICSGCID
jgi:hypothetical protein